MASVFRPFAQPRNLVNERDQMAADLAKEMIEAHKARQQAAKEAAAKGEPFDWTPEDQERIDTLDALMKGRHRHVVLPLMLEAFAQLTEPVKADEKPQHIPQCSALRCEWHISIPGVMTFFPVLCGKAPDDPVHLDTEGRTDSSHPFWAGYCTCANHVVGAEQALAGPCTQSEPEAD